MDEVHQNRRLWNRMRLIGMVGEGKLTRWQAERAARRLNWKPLASKPRDEHFDPLCQKEWTLPMAGAWIAWRSVDQVRVWWDEYATRCWYWHHRPWRVGVDGDVHHGAFLEAGSRPTMCRLRMAGIDEHLGFPSVVKPVSKAVEELLDQLRDGVLVACGKNLETCEREEIPAGAWRNFTLIERHDDDMLVAVPQATSGRGYRSIVVPSARVRELWLARGDIGSVELQLMAPKGEGYMPLFCAAHWIVTKGGTEPVPAEPAAWSAAFATLVEKIASGAVEVIGTAGAERVRIEPVQFAGVRVIHSFDPAAPDVAELGDDIALVTSPYTEEQSWRTGRNDTLTARSGPRWTNLMVPQEKLAEFWPSPLAPVCRTGAPGRPNSRQWVVAEFEARCERNEVLETLAEESRYLAEWLKETHRHVTAMTPNSVANAIRAPYNARKKAIKLSIK